MVARGAGNAAKNIAVLTMIRQRDSVYREQRTIMIRSAVKKKKDSRKRTIAPVGIAHIVVADGSY